MSEKNPTTEPVISARSSTWLVQPKLRWNHQLGDGTEQPATNSSIAAWPPQSTPSAFLLPSPSPW